jgi:glycerol-3-phosphate acyltransferase PlsY
MIGAREACVTLAIVLVIAYLLGSFPTSYLVVHLITGRDIRQFGSGNPGTMNVLDSVSRRAAVIVGVADIAKGTAAVSLAYLAGVGDIGAVAAGLAAVAGHDFSLFLRFHGGNGTAPATGALYALAPLTGLIATTGAVGIYLLLRSRRPAGMAALLIYAPLAYALGEPNARVAGAALLVTVTLVKIGLDEGFSFARPRHETRVP